MEQNKELTNLPNIGKTLAEKLRLVGIESIQDLKSVGSENAFIRLMTVDEGACLNMLCALEGAIQGVRWHSLNAGKKLELKQFYDQVKGC